MLTSGMQSTRTVKNRRARLNGRSPSQRLLLAVAFSAKLVITVHSENPFLGCHQEKLGLLRSLEGNQNPEYLPSQRDSWPELTGIERMPAAHKR
jgi:hypothetical protein